MPLPDANIRAEEVMLSIFPSVDSAHHGMAIFPDETALKERFRKHDRRPDFNPIENFWDVLLLITRSHIFGSPYLLSVRHPAE